MSDKVREQILAVRTTGLICSTSTPFSRLPLILDITNWSITWKTTAKSMCISYSREKPSEVSIQVWHWL